jgi:hypothetical protein
MILLLINLFFLYSTICLQQIPWKIEVCREGFHVSCTACKESYAASPTAKFGTIDGVKKLMVKQK